MSSVITTNYFGEVGPEQIFTKFDQWRTQINGPTVGQISGRNRVDVVFLV
jgi:hypothetical protein